jgi:hypothetical protein
MLIVLKTIASMFDETSSSVVQINASTNDLAKNTGDLKEIVSWITVSSLGNKGLYSHILNNESIDKSLS